jgi:hypothetical protein
MSLANFVIVSRKSELVNCFKRVSALLMNSLCLQGRIQDFSKGVGAEIIASINSLCLLCSFELYQSQKFQVISSRTHPDDWRAEVCRFKICQYQTIIKPSTVTAWLHKSASQSDDMIIIITTPFIDCDS